MNYKPVSPKKLAQARAARDAASNASGVASEGYYLPIQMELDLGDAAMLNAAVGFYLASEVVNPDAVVLYQDLQHRLEAAADKALR
jgi:hypothetical protein